MNKSMLIMLVVGLLVIGVFAIGLMYFSGESHTEVISGNVYRSSDGSLVMSNVSQSENTVVLLFNQRSIPLLS